MTASLHLKDNKESYLGALRNRFSVSLLTENANPIASTGSNVSKKLIENLLRNAP